MDTTYEANMERFDYAVEQAIKNSKVYDTTFGFSDALESAEFEEMLKGHPHIINVERFVSVYALNDIVRGRIIPFNKESISK